MADEETEDKPSGKSSLMMSLILSSVLAFIFGGAGYATVAYVGSTTAEEAAEEELEDAEPQFVEFGEVVVNLEEARMTRYLRTKLTLQVDGNLDEEALAVVETKRAILRNWLIGYLSDLQLEDIRGADGQNRIRRNVQNYFNDVLAPDGSDFVQDVLFEEFTIQ